jgi:type IV pilus assembly protein PilE
MRLPSRSFTIQVGMTLVELMIVLVVLAVLAAIAWPSYQSAVQRSRRADGVAALTGVMQAQERWRAKYPSYRASLSATLGSDGTVIEPALPGMSQNGHYALSLSNVSASGYTATATVQSGSPQVGDKKCQVLLVRVNGGSVSYSSKAAPSSADNATPDPCWIK